MPSSSSSSSLPLSAYPFQQRHQTRWSDNDQYSHMNNSVYYHLFDSIVNTYLIRHCGLLPNGPGERIGLVVESHCQFFAPLSFPQPLILGLRVTKLGRSSVTYEVGVFEDSVRNNVGGMKPAAVGGYTHVFVDSGNRKGGLEMPEAMRKGLKALMGDGEEKEKTKL
ncbi:thioesterase [Pterulicium gracile]|uniref:Thioesterase n=1 Tax=Pterulicium gracile TaxID=1884261 RepID=A0A5C3QE59_9AGAR|nr:thioesterase [Pterula gracilis]